MFNKLGTWLYRILEKLDGEKGKRIISYKSAEKIKIWLLRNWITGE